MAAQRLFCKPLMLNSPRDDGTEQVLIVRVEQVETGVTASSLFHGLGELVEFVSSGAGIFGGRELQITPVSGFQQLAQGGQAVDGFLHGGPFGFP